MSQPIPDESQGGQQQGNQPSLARQVLKFKKISKTTEKGLELNLEKIIGITSKGRNTFVYNPVTGELAYPAGSIAILYNPKTNKQVKYLFTGSKKPISAITFSPDGKYIAIACKGLEISIWDLQSDNKKPDYLLKGHRYGIENILFSPNMKYLVSIGDTNDRGLFVWDWINETRLTMNKINKKINSAIFTPTGRFLITAGEQHLKLWNFDAEGNIIFGKPKEAKEPTGDVSMNNTSTTTTTTTTTTSSSTPNIIEGKSASLGKMGDKTFMDIAYYNGQVFAITSDGILCIVNETTRMLEKWMELRVSTGFGLLVTSTHLICGCGDGFIRFFKLETMEHVFALPKPPALGSYNVERGTTKLKAGPHEKYADAIAITYDEKNTKLATLYSDRTIFIWDLRNTDKIVVYRSFLNHSSSIYDIQVLPSLSSYEISFLATGSSDKTVRIWYLADSDNKENEKVVKKNVYCKNLSYILYMNDNYEHFKYQHTSEVEKILQQDYQIRCLKCTYDGKFLACGDQAGFLRIYNLGKFELQHELKAHDQEILTLDFTPDNEEKYNFLATGSRDRLIHIYDVNKDFEIISTIDDHTSSISSVKFYYDKATKKLGLISCGAEKSIIFRQYNPETRVFESVHVEIDKNNKFYSLELNPENTQAVAGQDKKISIWQIDTGKIKCVYETKDEESTKATFVDNLKIITDMTGSYIATSHKDGNVRIRDYFTRNLIAKINCGDFTTGICFTQNNKNLITATSEGCLLIWKLPEEMTSNMNKKKAQLGIIVKKLNEFLEADGNASSLIKDLKIDSLLVEKELREYIARKNKEDRIKTSGSKDRIVSELESIAEGEKSPNKKPQEIKPLDLETVIEGKKESESSEKEVEKEKVVVESLIDPNELPSWARTHSIIGKIQQPTSSSNTKRERPVGKWGQRAEKNSASTGNLPTYQSESITEEKSKVSIDVDPNDIIVESKEDNENKNPNQFLTVQGEGLDASEQRFISPTKQNSIVERPQIDLGHGVRITYDAQVNQVTAEELGREPEKPDDAVYEEEKGNAVQEEYQSDQFVEKNYYNIDQQDTPSPMKKLGVQPVAEEKRYIGDKMPNEDTFSTDPNKKVITFKRQLDVPDLFSQPKEETKTALQTGNEVTFVKDTTDGRESIFDVNAIISQVNKVHQTVEKVEQALSTTGNSRYNKNLSSFDQSQTSGFGFPPVTERSEMFQSPLTKSPIRGEEEQEDLDERKNIIGDINPASSSVIKIDKSKLVPTTIDELMKKHASNVSSVAQSQVIDSPGHIKEFSKSPKRISPMKPDEKTFGEEEESQFIPPVNKSGIQENKMTFQAPSDFHGNMAPDFHDDSSIFQSVSKIEENQSMMGLESDSFSFPASRLNQQRPLSQSSYNIEAELEASFEIINNQLKKIDWLMGGLSYERNVEIRNKLMEKFDRGMDETRRSVNNLSMRSARQSTTMLNESQNMSEFIVNNSRDLLENYSKMLLQTFEKTLRESLIKK